MTISIENFEVYLLILVRITGFIFTAPFFSLRNVPVRVKAGLGIFIASIVFYTMETPQLEYSTIIEFSILVVKEALAGAILGLFANIAYYILNFAGQMLDMQIGFSMINELDPVTSVQSTISANFYGYLVLIIMMVTNLHLYFLKAVINSFDVIGIGKVNLNPELYKVMVQFITDYFVIGFRIILPVFAAILMIDTILAILAKIAPQLNMFVIGMQIKIFVGLAVMLLVIGALPGIADFIFEEMVKMLQSAIVLLK
jgi:flagellar biosynthetic protein FliR